MKTVEQKPNIEGFEVKGFYKKDTVLALFNKPMVSFLVYYADILGYWAIPTDPGETATAIKIRSKENPNKFGFLKQLIQRTDEGWKPIVMYGYYRGKTFIGRFPINTQIMAFNEYMYKKSHFKNPKGLNILENLMRIPDLESDTLRDTLRILHSERSKP